MDVVIPFVTTAIGIIIGIIIACIFFRPKVMGTLRLYNDENDGPFMFVELKEQPEEIMKKKRVIFDVNPDDYVVRNTSQE